MASLNKDGISDVDAFLQHYLKQHPEVVEDQRIAYERHWRPQGCEDPEISRHGQVQPNEAKPPAPHLKLNNH